MTETEIEIVKLGRKFLGENISDSKVLEQTKLLIEFGLFLLKLDKKYNQQTKNEIKGDENK